MKSYVLISVVLLGLALFVTVVIFVWIQSLANNQNKPNESQVSPEPTDSSSSILQTATVSIPELPALGVALDTLPVPTSTTELLEGVGLAPSALVITNAMVQCAIGAVGGERVASLMAGDTPTPLEVLSLLPCVRAE
jgi:hypothetical protein